MCGSRDDVQVRVDRRGGPTIALLEVMNSWN